MELKEFIDHTLTDIVQGTLSASDKLKDNIIVAPMTNKEYHDFPAVSFSSVGAKQAPLTVVSFKVNVEAVESHTIDGKVEAGFLNVVGANAKGEISNSGGTHHEVSFSVPFVWKQRGR